MATTTVFLPFYWGAASSAVLFPLFIVVACDTDADAIHRSIQAVSSDASMYSIGLGKLPIFWLALKLTQSLLGLKSRR
jgi:etoposide-induced 2.4 mRNA